MSFWGTLGKIALKVAPIAAAFIPGVGIPLAMAISGATGVASKKIEGGSWKDSLLSGGIDAGLAGVGGGLVKGLGPTASKLTKFGVQEAGQLGKNAINSNPSQPSQSSNQQSGNFMASNSPSVFGRTNPSGSSVGQAATRTGANGSSLMPRGGYNFANNPLNQSNQNSPNLAQSIFQGRQTAMKDQPFRAGYAVTMPSGEPIPAGSPEGTPFPTKTSYMPRISSDVRYGPGLFSYDQPQQQRRPRWNYAPPTPPSADASE